MTSQETKAREWMVFQNMLSEDGRDNAPAFLHSMRHLLDGMELDGKTVVEVGSGRGLCSIYASLSGASRVLSIEPELDGSFGGVLSTQRSRVSSLDLNIDILAEDFNTWHPAGQQFDMLMSINSINHLHESTNHAMVHAETWNRYVAVAKKMQSVLRPGGVAIVTDSSRYGLFLQGKYIGLHRPWTLRRSSVNWRIHQTPRTWRQIFLAAGFKRVDVDYPLPFRLRSLNGIVNTVAPQGSWTVV